jgi:hypothetical protein
MKRFGIGLAALLLWPLLAFADAPKVEPSQMATSPGKWFKFKAEADPKKTLVVGELPFNDFDVRPVAGGYRVDVSDKTPPGVYSLHLWYAGEVVALPKQPPLPSIPVATLTITVAGTSTPEPPKDPDAKPPVPVPTGSLYFMVIRIDGPADPAFTKIMSDSAWATLRAKGHQVKDFDAKGAARLGLSIPAGTRLPAVYVLRPVGQTSEVVRGPLPLPTTGAGILGLEKGP